MEVGQDMQRKKFHNIFRVGAKLEWTIVYIYIFEWGVETVLKLDVVTTANETFRSEKWW